MPSWRQVCTSASWAVQVNHRPLNQSVWQLKTWIQALNSCLSANLGLLILSSLLCKPKLFHQWRKHLGKNLSLWDQNHTDPGSLHHSYSASSTASSMHLWHVNTFSDGGSKIWTVPQWFEESENKFMTDLKETFWSIPSN